MKNKTQIIKGCALALIPTSVCATMVGINALNTVYADSESGYVNYCHETVSISNSSFEESNGSSFYSTNNFSNWTVTSQTEDSPAMGAIINTDKTFGDNKTKHHLNKNPGSYRTKDTNILMISATNKNGVTQRARKGYQSSSITLEANSFYKFSVAVKTTNENELAYASVYINGLKDNDGKDIDMKYEGLSNTTWNLVNFFIATGKNSQTITIDLYLGSASGQTSKETVFFDEVTGERFSENEFYKQISNDGFISDNYSESHSSCDDTIFLVNDLLEEKHYISNFDSYNFDFEDDIIEDTLGKDFSLEPSNHQNGYATVQNIADMQRTDFKKLTGYDYVGTDFGKENKNALILYTGKKVNGEMQSASGYVGVESREIDIKAHAIYKISMKVKVSQIDSGSFYFKVQENDNILNNYSKFLTADEDEAETKNKTLYTLNSGQSATISSETQNTNSFENDYQTISLYLKGNSLYDSSVNLELWLGDSSSNAKGCVVVDNITIEYATFSDYDSASYKLELSGTLPSDDGITNGRFNASQNQADEENYLVKASDWTADTNSNCDSGIVYLFNEDTFESMYRNNRIKYVWAGTYPGVIDNSDTKPNNVYLMNNRTKSSQSITSSAFTIETSTEDSETLSYHKLSFNYYTQNMETESKIKVEVIDDNGNILFSKSGITSPNKWGEFEVYFHTHELIAHTAQVKISLGEDDDEVCGLVYLDNFSFSSSSDYESKFASASNVVDLTKFGQDETTTSKLSLSNFYTFSDANGDFTSPTTSTGAGGIIDGKNNQYNENNDNLKRDGNFLVLSSNNIGHVKLTSNYQVAFKSNSYYKLSFDFATIFGESALSSKTDEHDCKYGLSVEIDGFETISGLLSANQFKSIEIFFKTGSTDATPNIVIKLITDCDNTFGNALISNLDITSATEINFKNAQKSTTLNDKVFVSNAIEEDTSNDDNSSSDTTDSEKSSSDNAWLLVPSIITGLAVIVGIIGYAMKHIKIKKIEKVKQEAYDRKLAVNHDAIVVQAQKRRDEELSALNEAKDSIEKEKLALEKEYNDFIRSSREKNGNELPRGLEKAFKAYSNKINRLNEKINIIKEKIDYTISAEYLLVLERRILAEQDENETSNKKQK